MSSKEIDPDDFKQKLLSLQAQMPGEERQELKQGIFDSGNRSYEDTDDMYKAHTLQLPPSRPSAFTPKQSLTTKDTLGRPSSALDDGNSEDANGLELDSHT